MPDLFRRLRAGRGLAALASTFLICWPLLLHPRLCAGAPDALAQPAANGTIPGAVYVESTFECIGARWYIQGDDNLNCSVSVQFRRLAASTWSDAQPLLRVEPGSYNSYGIDPGNLLAGSVFDLLPDTGYQVRLSLHDPDGGAAVDTVDVHTRRIPQAATDARVRY